MIVLQLHVCKVVPSTRISVQQRWGFDGLPPVLASFAFKGVMSFTKSILVELEKLSESVDREMSFGVFFLVDDGG